MGNYERTLTRIEELENMMESTEDPEERGLLQCSIGECNGYLQELADIDGYSSYDDM